MSRTVEQIAAGAPWEKTGNTSWVQCKPCARWFPAGPSILSRPEIKLHCPNCGNDFTQDAAARIIKAGP